MTAADGRSAVAPVAAILLAAGASRRLGEPKQLVVDEYGTALVVHSARQLLASGCSPVVVVIGANGQRVRDALHALPVHVCINDRWEDGIGASIRCGIVWLMEWSRESVQVPAEKPVPTPVPNAARHTIQATIIAACDMPGVTAGHLSELVAMSDHGTRRVGSVYGDRTGDPGVESQTEKPTRGIPTLFPKADWTMLLQLSGDRGAKRLIELPDTLSVFLRQGHTDIDTPADLAQWRAKPIPTP